MSRDRHAAQARGRWSETLCVWHLWLRGWSVLARGFTVGRGSGAGEVDIIARRGDLVAFIEVKARADWEQAAEAVGERQRRRIVRAAEAFLATHPGLDDKTVRFDAMLVAPGRWPKHLPDAWRVGE
jgi:putative endonuclease